MQWSPVGLLLGHLAAMLRESGECSGLEGLQLALMQLAVFLFFGSRRRDVLVPLVVAVRDGPLLLADGRQVLVKFGGGGVRSGLEEVAAVLGDGCFVGLHLPGREEGELAVLPVIVSAAHWI